MRLLYLVFDFVCHVNVFLLKEARWGGSPCGNDNANITTKWCCLPFLNIPGDDAICPCENKLTSLYMERIWI